MLNARANQTLQIPHSHCIRPEQKLCGSNSDNTTCTSLTHRPLQDRGTILALAALVAVREDNATRPTRGNRIPSLCA